MWSLDRRVAAAALVGAAIVLAGPIAASDPADPIRTGPDPTELARDLAALANRGARATWMVTYGFTRFTASHDKLRETIVVAHVPGTATRAALDVDDGLGSTVVVAGSRTYSCTVPSDVPECLERATTERTARPGAVYGGAVVSGRYSISGARTMVIAGLRAQCFTLRLRKGTPIPGLGFASRQCYSNDGVPLLSRVQTAAATDVRTAIVVRRTVGSAELLPLLEPYGLERLAPAR